MRALARLLTAAGLMVLAFSAPALAVKPDEMLADPSLEARARAISQGLRCLVCQNESIDDSDADLARDLRLLVRERLKAGDTDDQVVDYIVSRYGEFVLLKPRFDLRNALLWTTPLLVLLCGGGFILVSRARRRPDTAPLSDRERADLDAILRGD